MMPDRQARSELSTQFGRTASAARIASEAFGFSSRHQPLDVYAGCVEACAEGNFKNLAAWLAASSDQPPGQRVVVPEEKRNWPAISASIEKEVRGGQRAACSIIKELVSGITTNQDRDDALAGIATGAIINDNVYTFRAAVKLSTPYINTLVLARAPGLGEAGMGALIGEGADFMAAAKMAEKSDPDRADAVRRYGLSMVHHYYEAGRYGQPEDVGATELRHGGEHSASVRFGAIDKALKGEGFANLGAWFTAAEKRDPGQLNGLMRHDLRDIATALDGAQRTAGNAAEVIHDMLSDVDAARRQAIQRSLLSEAVHMLAAPEQLMYALHKNGTDFSKVAAEHPKGEFIRRMDGLFRAMEVTPVPGPVPQPVSLSQAITAKIA
jgi:hypothetical protein